VKNGVFERAGAIEAPVVLGDGLGEVGFEGAEGGEFFADGVAVFLERGLIFRRVDDDLAGEAVAEGVQQRTFLAFFGTGAGGELRVAGLHNSFQPILFQIKVRMAA
jgi:hypothetical protein